MLASPDSSSEVNIQEKSPQLSNLSKETLPPLLLDIFMNHINQQYLVTLDGEQLLINNAASEFLASFGYPTFRSLFADHYEQLSYLFESCDENPKTSVYCWFENKKKALEEQHELSKEEGRLVAQHVHGGFYKVSINAKSEINDAYPVLGLSIEEADKDIVDPITGAFNSKIVEHYANQVDSLLSSNPNYPVTIILADTDNLKKVNDTYGHVNGDRSLRATANCIRRSARPNDPVFRIGGAEGGSDEFFGILINAGAEQTASIRTRLREADETAAKVRAAQLGGTVNLPDRIASYAVISSDSELFDPERSKGITIDLDLLLSVGDRVRYVEKETSKIVDKVKGAEKPVDLVFQEVVGLVKKKRILNSNREAYYLNMLMNISENLDSFGFSSEDIETLNMSLFGHEIGANPDIEVSVVNMVNHECERKRVPKYSETFFNKLYHSTEIDLFEKVSKIVSRHHYCIGKQGTGPRECLNIENSKEDKMANMINIIDAYYSMCLRKSRISDDRPKFTADEALIELDNNPQQFSPELVTILKNMLPKNLDDKVNQN